MNDQNKQPETPEAPPVCRDWREGPGDRCWRMRLPTGHTVRLDLARTPYMIELPDGSRRQRNMTTYRGAVTSQTGETAGTYTMSNDAKAARAFMEDRAYRHAYGLANYILMCRTPAPAEATT